MSRLIVRKNQVSEERYNVTMYTREGAYLGIVSGMGRNKGKWDAEHGRSAAYRHAAHCRKDDPQHIYRVEPVL